MKRRVTLLFVASLLIARSLFAHEDPTGDVHPKVRVEKGNFAIYFSNTSEHRELDEEPPMFRVVYSPEGELLAPRHQVAGLPPVDVRVSRGGVTGITVPVGDELLVFPQYSRLFHDKPFYTVESKDRIERRRLPWPDGVKISDLHSILADDHSITIAAKAGAFELALYHFQRDRFELPQIIPIGSPLTIYDFPTASNLVFAGGKYWIAWMRGGKEYRKVDVVLSSWRPGDNAAVETVLDGPGDWNSDLSMQVSGDFLCIAYHYSVFGNYPGRSKINTFFRRVK